MTLLKKIHGIPLLRIGLLLLPFSLPQLAATTDSTKGGAGEDSKQLSQNSNSTNDSNNTSNLNMEYDISDVSKISFMKTVKVVIPVIFGQENELELFQTLENQKIDGKTFKNMGEEQWNKLLKETIQVNAGTEMGTYKKIMRVIGFFHLLENEKTDNEKFKNMKKNDWSNKLKEVGIRVGPALGIHKKIITYNKINQMTDTSEKPKVIHLSTDNNSNSNMENSSTQSTTSVSHSSFMKIVEAVISNDPTLCWRDV